MLFRTGQRATETETKAGKIYSMLFLVNL